MASDVPQPRWRLSPLALVLIAAAVLVCLIVMVTLLKSKPPGNATASGRTSGESLESVRNSFLKAVDSETLRGAVQQLNGYLASHPDEKSHPLNPLENKLLQDEYHLDDDELAEVYGSDFTLLDAHHLDLCFLLHDAVRSLKVDRLPPLQRAMSGFSWVVRQVRLRERPGTLSPPHFVLRRGWGNAQERALVFLALLDQLGIDGCMLIVPGEAGQPRLRYWVPGALVDKEIYLFDARLGLPLPGPNGQGVATLAQVRTKPELLHVLTVDAKYPYDVKAEQAKQAEVYVACALSALAPRMRYLQEILSTNNAIYLSTDPATLLKRFQAATKGSGTSVRVWNHPGDFNTPIRALRQFLPPEEGGIDKTQRLQQAKMELIPWDYLPKPIQQLPGEPGRQLQQIFATPFVDLPLKARISREYLIRWLPGLVKIPSKERAKEGHQPEIPEALLRERMPRDLVLRGRFEEAALLLDAMQGEFRRQKELRAQADLDGAVREWCRRAIAVYDALHNAQEQAKNPRRKSAADPMILEEANEGVKRLWNDGDKVFTMLQGAAAEPLYGEVVYLLALTKQEQAERQQARLEGAGAKATADEVERAKSAWNEADSWWVTYIQEQQASPNAPTARLFRARAHQCLGERDRAAALLQDLSGNLTDLEKTARLYLATQLKKR